jgi:hypothetical protein
MQFAKGHKQGRRKKAQGRDKLMSALGAVAVTFGFGQQAAEAQQAATTIQPGNAVEAAGLAASGELTASKIIKDPGAPYENVFRDFGVGLGASPKVGPGQGRVQAGPFNLGLDADSPLNRGFRPEEAEIKIGDFYLDVRELRASMLFSDNVNRTQNNRKSDVAAAVTLGLSAMYQFTEGLRVAVSGAVIYLPIENKIGVQGFGLVDPFLRFNIDGGALARAQIYYDFLLGKWYVTVYDDFRIVNRTSYHLAEDQFVDLYDGETFNNSSTVRNNQLYSPQQYQSPQFQDQGSSDRFDITAIDYQNTVGAFATRDVIGENQALLRYDHSDFWYSSDSNNNNLVPRASSSDRFVAGLNSVKENLRFKPFIRYTASTTDRVSGWDQQITGGLEGPITDQLSFYGEAGYLFSGNTSRETMVWQAGLRHVASPYTAESLRYYRVLSDPDRILTQRLEYSLSQILGPYMRATFFASKGEYEDLDNGNSLASESRLGLTFSYDLGEFGRINSGVVYSDVEFENPASIDYSVLTYRLDYSLAIGARTKWQFFYQFEQFDAKQGNNSYYENLVGSSISHGF